MASSPTYEVLQKDVDTNTITAPVVSDALPMAVQGAAPATEADIGKHFSKTYGGRVEAHYVDDTGVVTRLTENGSVAGASPPGVTNINALLTTNNNTPVTIYTYTPLADDRLIAFQLQVMASMQVDTALFVMAVLCRINGGSTVELDTYFVNGPFRENGAWDVTVNATGAGGTIEFIVTGNFDATDWRIIGTATECTIGAGAGA
jgi:hypothetical protein